MADLVPLALLLAAMLAMMVARAMLMAAREHVRTQHPDWFAALGAGRGFRMGGPDERARQRLLRPLLFGPLPASAAGDPVLRRLAEHLRLMMGTAACSVAGLVLIIVLRSGAGG